MSGMLSMVFGVAILVGLLVLGFVALYHFFGRRKQSEDKAIGVLEQMSFFKNMTGSTNNRTR